MRMTWRRHFQLHARDYFVALVVVLVVVTCLEWAYLRASPRVYEQIDIPSTTLIVDGP